MRTPLTIAQRLALGFSLVLSLMLLISLIGINRVGLIDQTLTDVSDGATVKQRYAINFRGSVHDRAISIRDAVLETDSRALSRHTTDIDKLKSFYAESAAAMDTLFAQTSPTRDELRLLEDIKSIERTTLARSEELLRMRTNNDIDGARALLLAEVSGGYSEWLKRINAFIDYQEAAIGKDIGQVRDVAGGFKMLILLVTGLAVVLSVGV